MDLFAVFTPYFALYGLFSPKDAYVYYSGTFTAPSASYDFVHILVLKALTIEVHVDVTGVGEGVINLYNRGRGLVFRNLRSPADFRKFLWNNYLK